MKVLPNGDFVVAASEAITFKVRRKNTPCQASFDCAGWASCGPVTDTDDHTKVKTCTATRNSGDESLCTITVDFRQDASGTFDPTDRYTVEITGSHDGSFTEDFTPPPVLNGRTYHFTVE
ncbi:MAG: hypothetical protein LAP21_18825 [Acidobacteriia bacterium]|nr:hypothetical protein [Terriglobia bacterium]